MGCRYLVTGLQVDCISGFLFTPEKICKDGINLVADKIINDQYVGQSDFEIYLDVKHVKQYASSNCKMTKNNERRISSRYLVTGVQLGMIKGFLSTDQKTYTKEIRLVIGEIIENQYVGDSILRTAEEDTKIIIDSFLKGGQIDYDIH